MEATSIVVISQIALVAFSALSFGVVDYLLLAQLEEQESSTYERLGKPHFFVHLAPKFRYWYSFLLWGGYKDYGLSKKTIRLCRANRILLLILHAAFAILLYAVGSSSC